MTASIQISVLGEGPNQIVRELAALVAAGEDLSELNSALGLEFEAVTTDLFDLEQDVDGNALKPSIRAKTEGGKTLTDSGRYKASITSESDARTIRWGSNVIYAGPNNEGATIRAKSGGKLKFQLPGGLGFRSVDEVILPARRVIGFGPRHEEAARDMTTEFFPGKAPGLFAGGTA